MTQYDNNLTFCKFRIPNNSGRVIWEVTNECNYSCSYCIFASTGKKPEGELSFDKIVKTLHELKNNNFTHIKFTGGEPFLRSDMSEILKLACSLGFVCDISTNASRFTEDIIHTLNQLPLEMIHISLDGHTQEIHEAVRGKKSFIPTINGIHALIKNAKTKSNIRIGCVIHEYNENFLPEMIDFCSQLNIFEVIFSMMEPVGRLKNKTTGLAKKSPAELYDIIEKKKKIINTQMKISHNLNFETKIHFKENIDNHCPAIERFLFINSVGIVSPCTWISEHKPYYNIGSLHSSTLSELLKSKSITNLNMIKKNMINSCPIDNLNLFNNIEKNNIQLSNFGKEGAIYSFSTENLEFMKKIDFNKKSVLTVGGSFDQAIVSSLFNASEVQCFDINQRAKFYGELKYHALQHLSYEQFLAFFMRGEKSFEKSIFNRLKHYLSNESKDFFVNSYHEYKTGFSLRESIIFNNKYDNKKEKIYNSFYLQNELNYQLAQEKIRNMAFSWQYDDIKTYSSNKKWDIILLSNIADYSHKMYSGQAHALMYKDNIVTKFLNYLRKDGILMFAYIFD